MSLEEKAAIQEIQSTQKIMIQVKPLKFCHTFLDNSLKKQP